MPRIAIPLPHSSDREYAERAIPQYERAVEQAGGEPVRIPLDESPEKLTKLIASCDAVLLPGSKADVDPAKFRAPRSPHTAAADIPRNTIDELLLEDAYRQRKPILGICYGLQSLNVFRAGSLIQHIPDFLPEETRKKVNHEAGKTVAIAHAVEIANNSKLAEILSRGATPTHAETAASAVQRSEASANSSQMPPARAAHPPNVEHGPILLPVNSSHHQSAAAIGTGLRIVARCPTDGIIEAVEGTSPDHFVLAVQWHPERSTEEEDEAARAIFRALISATEDRRNQRSSKL
jgi:putative glutamine amidotransferase